MSSADTLAPLQGYAFCYDARIVGSLAQWEGDTVRINYLHEEEDDCSFEGQVTLITMANRIRGSACISELVPMVASGESIPWFVVKNSRRDRYIMLNRIDALYKSAGDMERHLERISVHVRQLRAQAKSIAAELRSNDESDDQSNDGEEDN